MKEAEILEVSEKKIEWSDCRDYIIDIVQKDFFEEFLKNFP